MDVQRAVELVQQATALVIWHEGLAYSIGNGNPRLLSARELEVFRLLARGMSAKQAAIELALAQKTVEVHRHNIYRKLNIQCAAQLVHCAIASGLVEAGDCV